MKKVLLIGSTGFLGGALKSNLPSKKFEIYTLDRNCKPSTHSVQLSNENLESIIATVSFDAIIACGWDGVLKEYRNNWEQQLSNVGRIEGYLRAAIAGHIPIFISLGSQAEGEDLSSPIEEGILESNSTAYSHAKTTLSRNLFEIAHGSGTRVLWARVFSVYGPGDHQDSLVSTCVSAFFENRLNSINNPELEWSFLYISDFINAIDSLLSQSDLEGVVNIANPKMEKLIQIHNCLLEINPTLARLPEALQQLNNQNRPLIPKVEKIMLTGWKPQVSFSDGIKKTISYLKDCEE